jgi:hypothetical protein
MTRVVPEPQRLGKDRDVRYTRLQTLSARKGDRGHLPTPRGSKTSAVRARQELAYPLCRCFRPGISTSPRWPVFIAWRSGPDQRHRAAETSAAGTMRGLRRLGFCGCLKLRVR